jgi:hypothetical protein
MTKHLEPLTDVLLGFLLATIEASVALSAIYTIVAPNPSCRMSFRVGVKTGLEAIVKVFKGSSGRGGEKGHGQRCYVS